MNVFRRFFHLTRWHLGVLQHLRLTWWLALVLIALIAGGVALRELNFGRAEPRFLVHYCAGVYWIAGTLLAVLASPALFLGGLQDRTVELLLLRGARRGEVIASQWMALTLALAAMTVLAGMAAAALLAATGHSASIGTCWQLIAGHALALTVLVAAALCCAALVQGMLLASTLTLGFALAGQLAGVLAQLQASATGPAWVVWTMLHALMPDLAGVATAGWSLLPAAGGWIFLYLALAMMGFIHREI